MPSLGVHGDQPVVSVGFVVPPGIEPSLSVLHADVTTNYT